MEKPGEELWDKRSSWLQAPGGSGCVGGKEQSVCLWGGGELLRMGGLQN